jgi:hypothetical protein
MRANIGILSGTTSCNPKGNPKGLVQETQEKKVAVIQSLGNKRDDCRSFSRHGNTLASVVRLQKKLDPVSFTDDTPT